MKYRHPHTIYWISSLATIDAVTVSKCLVVKPNYVAFRVLFFLQGIKKLYFCAEFYEVLHFYGIPHLNTTPWYPTPKSIVERIHLSIGNSICCSQSSNILDIMPANAWSLNDASHYILGCFSAELVFGCNFLYHSIKIDTDL